MNRPSWIFMLLLSCLLFFQTGCGSLASSSTYSVQKDLVFKSVDGVDLKGDLYEPAEKGAKPAVLVVHGGGWDKKTGDMESLCRDLAQAGFVVFNTDYRLAPGSLYPKAVDDVRDSLTWLKAHAEKFEIDPRRISGWGYSAGAHLILLVGLDPSQGLKALVAGGTPADLTAWPDSPLVLKFLGVPRDSHLALWQEASPVNHVEKNSPPVFLYHGEWDHLVEIEQMNKMKAALGSKGVPVETFQVPMMGHVAVYLFSQKSVDKGIEFIKARVKPILP